MSDGDWTLAGGPGPTTADLDELVRACGSLDRAADRLDSARVALDRGSDACASRLLVVSLSPDSRPERQTLVAALDALAVARDRHGRAADEVRRLASRLRRVVAFYGDAESTADRALRTALAGLTLEPVVAAQTVVVGAVAVGATAGIVGPPLLAAEVLSRLRHRTGPLTALASWSTADGRAALALMALALFVRSLLGGRVGTSPDAVTEAAAQIAGLLPPARPTVVVPRDRPPQLLAPRTTADVLRNVAASAQIESGVPGLVSVQRLTHPDGTRAWVVEIPGTEDWRFNSDVPMDMTTNLRLMAGLPDDMTGSVLHAMARAGVGPGEPVMLAGHSQGGMVATSVAAAAGAAFTIRAVATAGSPDTPHAVPDGIQVRSYRHGEDVVPQTDGEPDHVGPDVTVVREDMQGSPWPVAAHDIRGYVESAELPVPLGPFDDAVASVLGPPGTTAVTFQFEVTRDPAVVAATQPTIAEPGHW